ncbi:MAG: hypothetical protein ACLUAR_16905 [Pilosibacter sp.]
MDGTMCTGGAVCIIFMLNGHSVGVSLFCGVYRRNDRGPGDRNLSHGDAGIPAIPAGILTQLGLYSINLRIMGGTAKSGSSAWISDDLLVSLQVM